MYVLDTKWPSLELINGIDLSTFKLAICEDKKSSMVIEWLFELQFSIVIFDFKFSFDQPESKSTKYILHHWAAEDSHMTSDSQDLVSLCLVAYESPKWVSERICSQVMIKPTPPH